VLYRLLNFCARQASKFAQFLPLCSIVFSVPRYIAVGNEATRCDDSAVIDLGASSAQVLAGPHPAAVAARENAR